MDVEIKWSDIDPCSLEATWRGVTVRFLVHHESHVMMVDTTSPGFEQVEDATTAEISMALAQVLAAIDERYPQGENIKPVPF